MFYYRNYYKFERFQEKMPLVNVKKQSPNLIDILFGKCPFCLKGRTDAILIAEYECTSEETRVRDSREERNRYHAACMEENIKQFPDYMQLRGGAKSHHLHNMYHLRYLRDAQKEFSSIRKVNQNFNKRN